MSIDLNSMIDHTLLKPEATSLEIIKLTKEAIKYQFVAVCVNPAWVKVARKELNNSSVKVCTVIGFPLGATTTETKVFETKQAIADGATEIDMVINVGALKEKQDNLVRSDIKAVVEVAKENAITKVIIETALLNEEEKIRACQLAIEAGADFVKTSTGFSSQGATVSDIQLMREIVGPNIGVKASGGIRDRASAITFIEAGATRIGTSAGIAIVSS